MSVLDGSANHAIAPLNWVVEVPEPVEAGGSSSIQHSSGQPLEFVTSAPRQINPGVARKIECLPTNRFARLFSRFNYEAIYMSGVR